MPMDPNLPTDGVIQLCACPIEWEHVTGFGPDRLDAHELLLYEWVRTVKQVSFSSEELKLLESVLFEGGDYEPPHEHTLENLKIRRPEAREIYLKGIGRLGNIKFARPSEHAKHFTAGGPTAQKKNISSFHVDWSEETLADVFWSWFASMFVVTDRPYREGPIEFEREVNELWEQLSVARCLRVAMRTPHSIGEQNGTMLSYLAIDLNLQHAEAHAYPISETEATRIMKAFDVLEVTPKEF